MGKTRLTEEMAVEAVGRGLQVFFGHAHEGEGSPPYIAFVEVLETALARAPSPQSFGQALGEEAAEVAKLLPRLRRLCPDLPPPLELRAEQERRLLFNSIREVVARAGREQPMLLVLEDLHWADEVSLLLLEHFAEQLPELPVLVVATYRDTELDAGGPLAKTSRACAAPARQLDAARPPPRGRGRRDAGCPERPGGARSPRPDPVRRDRRRPFFVEEVSQHLAGGGPAPRRRGSIPDRPRWTRRTRRGAPRHPPSPPTPGREHPPGPGRSGGARASPPSSCSRPCRSSTPTCCWTPSRCRASPPHRHGFRYLWRGPLPLHPRADPPDAAGRPLPSPPSPFRPRCRDAMALHYATSLDEHAAGIAHHLLEAGAAADPSRAFHFLIRAGQWAMATSAYEEALRHYERASACGTPPSRRSGLRCSSNSACPPRHRPQRHSPGGVAPVAGSLRGARRRGGGGPSLRGRLL